MRYVIGLSLSIVVISGLAWYLSHGVQAPVSEGRVSATLPQAGDTPSNPSVTEMAPAESSSVLAADGATLTTTDFLRDSRTTEVTQGYFFLGGLATTTAVVPYVVMFIPATNYFNIEILQEPIGESRLQAEQYLEAYLGLGPRDLCRLNYSIGAPNSVNSQYAGVNLGFSFCPGAVVLPQ